ncbi:hypothetical protein BG023_11623 [Porphyrobacter sp. LM 6]|nr:hypothetical protein BG023_11623 [Porphyrobacter sp. LM 6]
MLWRPAARGARASPPVPSLAGDSVPLPLPRALCQKHPRPRPCPVRRYGISLSLRGSLRAVTTCRKRRRRSDLLGAAGAAARHRSGVLHPAVLFARLSDRGDLRLLAHLEDAARTRRADGAAARGRSVLLLHAGRDLRRAYRLCAVLHRRRYRHPQRFHRFFGRRDRIVEAAALVGWRDELPRRARRGDAGDGVGGVARQAELHPRGRLRQRRGADGDAARTAGEFRQWRAVGPRHRCGMGHGLPQCRRSAAPPEPALSGRARRLAAADCHDAAVLEDPRALPSGPAGGGVHLRHRDFALH